MLPVRGTDARRRLRHAGIRRQIARHPGDVPVRRPRRDPCTRPAPVRRLRTRPFPSLTASMPAATLDHPWPSRITDRENSREEVSRGRLTVYSVYLQRVGLEMHFPRINEGRKERIPPPAATDEKRNFLSPDVL